MLAGAFQCGLAGPLFFSDDFAAVIGGSGGVGAGLSGFFVLGGEIGGVSPLMPNDAGIIGEDGGVGAGNLGLPAIGIGGGDEGIGISSVACGAGFVFWA